MRSHRPGDAAAQLLLPLAVVCRDPHRRVQAESVDVGAQALARCGLARPRAPEGQPLMPGARAEGDAVGNGRRLQRMQGARLLTVDVGFGQVGLAHLLNQHSPARGHLQASRDDRLQQRVQLVVGGWSHLDEGRRDVGTARPARALPRPGAGAPTLRRMDMPRIAFISGLPRTDGLSTRRVPGG